MVDVSVSKGLLPGLQRSFDGKTQLNLISRRPYVQRLDPIGYRTRSRTDALHMRMGHEAGA